MTQIQVEIKELENGEVEINGSIPHEIFDKHISLATKNISKNIEISGFRKGHIPEKVLIQKVGEGAILEEAADITLKEEFPKIIIENKIDTIGRPTISITKLAKGNPLEFKATIAIMPKIELPDYKTLAKKVLSKKEKVEVTDKEVDDTVNEIRKMRVKGTKDNNQKKEEKEAEENLPKIDDEFVKTLGDFKNVSDFKEKLKKNITTEKEKKAKDKKRAEIMEEVIKGAKTTIPNIMIESELDKMISQFKDDIARSGGTFEEYLKHIKKTEEDMRKEWRTDAEKRAKSQLVLNKIATEEKITAPKDELDKQASSLLEQYKDADPARVRIYIETILTNEEVFKFLEKQETTK